MCDLVVDVRGDLFSSNCSLAHCVSRDLKMGAGSATKFRDRFDCVEELKQQDKQIGEVAWLKHEDKFIFYLITKERYYGKPTYKSLTASLHYLRDLAISLEVKCIAMPRIGCGLDKLKWLKVRSIICDVFCGSGIRITIYTL